MATVYDLLRSVALIVGVGYTARQDRKTWMWGESVMWGCYAFGLFLFPRSLFPGNDSDVIAYLVRAFAAWIVGMESMWYLSRRSRDENVIGALLWSRLMGSLTLLFVLAYFYSQDTDRLISKTLYFDVVAYALLLVSTVYKMWYGDYRVGGREQRGPVSLILRLNFLILFITGLAFLAYPTWVFLFKVDPFGRLLVQCVGAMLFGISFTAWYATSFRFDDDRTSFFLSQILGFKGRLLVQCVGAMLFGISFTAWYATSFRFDDDRTSFFLSQILAISMVLVSLNISYFFDGLVNSREALMMHLGLVPAVLPLIGIYLIRSKDNGNHSNYFLRSKSD